jgi:DNA-binding transcriptional MocR family regulator
MDSISAHRLSGQLGELPVGRLPLYGALSSRLRMLIADGRLPVGARLPAERELAAAMGLSRVTVSSAYARLREDGWASARRGAGTFSALPAGTQPAAWVPAPPDEAVIDLAHAAPSAPPEVAAAYAAALADLPRLLPSHGYAPAGLPELRARIADRYTSRGLATTPEQILVTSGALHGSAWSSALCSGGVTGCCSSSPPTPTLWTPPGASAPVRSPLLSTRMTPNCG